ncbi:hypothetical protein EYF80_007863 [Liparis tanakae]|uniref:Uncharacterized protein n=1 Tax=Liparis tanakae TaxID=230148 RepID=A0A4Z2IVH3_9TELE|nr:hypothetical protein EYF80_007863 [Liparis tanakae]
MACCRRLSWMLESPTCSSPPRSIHSSMGWSLSSSKLEVGLGLRRCSGRPEVMLNARRSGGDGGEGGEPSLRSRAARLQLLGSFW